MGAEPAEEEHMTELSVAVVGMGQWALKAYATGLQKFAEAWFLDHLTIWFFDRDPTPDKRRQVADTFGFGVQAFSRPERWRWAAQQPRLTVHIVRGTGPRSKRRSTRPWRKLLESEPDKAWCQRELADVGVVFIVSPPLEHASAVRGWHDLGVRCIVVEKPFCTSQATASYALAMSAVEYALTLAGTGRSRGRSMLTQAALARATHLLAAGRRGELARIAVRAALRLAYVRRRQTRDRLTHIALRFAARQLGGCRPSDAEWTEWLDAVFYFDHYFVRLWAFAYFYAGELGKAKKIRFRMLEPNGKAAARRRLEGPVLDLAAHAVPLLLLFANPPESHHIEVIDPRRDKCRNPAYFHFWEHNWPPRGASPFAPRRTLRESFDWLLTRRKFYVKDILLRLVRRQSRTRMEVEIGWRCKLEPGTPRKLLFTEFHNGWTWADLAEPFQILLGEPPAPALNRGSYLGLTPARRLWAFAATDPVHLMVAAVLTDVVRSAPPPPLTVLPVSDGGRGRHPLTAKHITLILDAWDEKWRSA